MRATDLTQDVQRAAWGDHLGTLLRDRRVICALAPLAGYVDWVALLEQARARRPLLVASAVGAGRVPRPDQADVVVLDVPRTATLTEEVRQQDAVLRALPDDLVRAVEAYDPAGEALWLTSPFITPAPLLGREVVSGRPPEWVALEDKLVVDDIWDALGVPRSPSRIVAVDPGRLRSASADLDEGAGVVWAGDAREGFHGGGDFVRWVVTEADTATAYDFFRRHCDRVRVMPFLDGVPCSIHGFVLPDGTATFRPVELAILRDAGEDAEGGGRHFVYGGLGTTWDPPPEDRAQMRDLARRTGEWLRELVGYRGAFGIDGVLASTGFRPTELNTRMSAGIGALGRRVDPVAFNLLQFNLLAGRDPGVGVEPLEAWAVPAMDEARFAGASAMCPRRVVDDPWEAPVEWRSGTLVRSREPTGWSVAAGPNAAGTFCRLSIPPGTAPPLRVAELNVALMRFLDAELGTGFGPVTAAPDVRR
jgi:hypothetical protein